LLYLVAIGWIYVVGIVAVAEAFAPQGTWLGAGLTFVGWGLLPLSIVLYILGTPVRRRARRAKDDAAGAGAVAPASGVEPDRGGHAAGIAIAPEREEP
jgi:hypothetical protein